MKIGINRSLFYGTALSAVVFVMAGCRQANPPVAESSVQSEKPASTLPAGQEPAASVGPVTSDDPFAVTGIFSPVTTKLEGFAVIKSCNTDSVVDSNTDKEVPVLSRQAMAKLIGWAADAETGALPKRVAVLLRGSDDKFYVVGGELSLDRQDVVSATGKSGLLKSGFSIPVSLSGVEAGSYTLDVLMDFGSTKASCTTAKTLQIE